LDALVRSTLNQLVCHAHGSLFQEAFFYQQKLARNFPPTGFRLGRIDGAPARQAAADLD
jgi:hypothetical protein